MRSCYDARHEMNARELNVRQVMVAEIKSKFIEGPQERAPVPLGHMAVHDTVIDVFKELPRGTLLDAPAGEGALAARLIEAGFDVRCCDLYPSIFRLPGVEIKQGNLSATLPYADGEFQYITCLEGLEHILNPSQAVSEFYRLLQPGGHIVISVPNVLNIEERFKWLIHGYTSHFKPLSREHVAGLRRDFGSMEEIALHVHPIAYTELRYYLEEHGFRVERVLRDKPKAHLWLYWPVTALIKLIGRTASKSKRRERWVDELNSDEVLLGGNTLIVHAVKIK